jgi:hypothetical protein
VKVLCLVALTGNTPHDEVAVPTGVVWHEEVGAQSVERLLDAFMAHPVGLLEHDQPTARVRR